MTTELLNATVCFSLRIEVVIIIYQKKYTYKKKFILSVTFFFELYFFITAFVKKSKQNLIKELLAS